MDTITELTQPHTITGRTHPATSVDAAARALGRTSAARYRVLAALYERPSTDEELQAALGLGANSERPRRVELVDLGLVAATGHRRPTSTGALSMVWATTGHGVLALMHRTRS